MAEEKKKRKKKAATDEEKVHKKPWQEKYACLRHRVALHTAIERGLRVLDQITVEVQTIVQVILCRTWKTNQFHIVSILLAANIEMGCTISRYTPYTLTVF